MRAERCVSFFSPISAFLLCTAQSARLAFCIILSAKWKLFESGEIAAAAAAAGDSIYKKAQQPPHRAWSAEKRSISFFSALCSLPVADGARVRLSAYTH